MKIAKADSGMNIDNDALQLIEENEEFQKKIKELEKEIQDKQRPLFNENERLNNLV